MKKMNFKSESGFTLMELMVVVGVLAILIAILLPQFTGYTAQAQAVSAASQVKNALTAGYSYYVSATARDNSGFQQTVAEERMRTAVKSDGTVTGNADGKAFTYEVTKGNMTFKATLDITTGTIVSTTGSGTGTSYGGAAGEMLCSGSDACDDLQKEGALKVQ